MGGWIDGCLRLRKHNTSRNASGRIRKGQEELEGTGIPEIPSAVNTNSPQQRHYLMDKNNNVQAFFFQSLHELWD